jgi:hypothetical protein
LFFNSEFISLALGYLINADGIIFKLSPAVKIVVYKYQNSIAQVLTLGKVLISIFKKGDV